MLSDDVRNNGFVTGLVDGKRGRRMKASRRGFLKGTIAAAAATTTVTAMQLFGPARRVEAQGGVVGTYPRRILQYCPPLNRGDNCQPGCGSSPICTDCCTSDGFFRNDPGRGYTLYAGGCGSGDIADGWLWRFSGKCGSCAEIEYRCSDGYVQTDQGPAPFICRAVTDCVPLAEGEEAGPDLGDAARPTNWKPAGRIELAIDQGNAVALSGWIADGLGRPIQMRVRANNQIVHLGVANVPRADIANSVRGAGTNVGFTVTVPLEPGRHELCVDAMDGVLTANMGCVNVTVGSGEAVRGSGSNGSIAQQNTPPAAPATNDPAPTESSPTESPAPEPTAVVLPEPDGESPSPTYGAVQVIRRSNEWNGFVSGWAGDPDTEDPAFIEVLVDGESALVTLADLPRPDVAAAFEGLSGSTGFAVSFPLPAEAKEVCVVAVSPDDGSRRPLGCTKLVDAAAAQSEADDSGPSASGPTAAGESVIYGGIDDVAIVPSATTGGTVTVTGWAFDPNDRDRVVDISASTGTVTASAPTGQDNAAAQRIYGIDIKCGFELGLELPPGNHQLTVTAKADDGSTIQIDQQNVFVS